MSTKTAESDLRSVVEQQGERIEELENQLAEHQDHVGLEIARVRQTIHDEADNGSEINDDALMSLHRIYRALTGDYDDGWVDSVPHRRGGYLLPAIINRADLSMGVGNLTSKQAIAALDQDDRIPEGDRDGHRTINRVFAAIEDASTYGEDGEPLFEYRTDTELNSIVFDVDDLAEYIIDVGGKSAFGEEVNMDRIFERSSYNKRRSQEEIDEILFKSPDAEPEEEEETEDGDGRVDRAHEQRDESEDDRDTEEIEAEMDALMAGEPNSAIEGEGVENEYTRHKEELAETDRAVSGD